MNYDSSKGPIPREAFRDGMRAEYLGDKGTIYVSRTGSIDFIPDDREIPCRALLHRNYTQWDGIQLLLTPPSIEHGLQVNDILKSTSLNPHCTTYVKVNGICGDIVFLSPEYTTIENCIKSTENLLRCHKNGQYVSMFTLHLPTPEDPKENEVLEYAENKMIHNLQGWVCPVCGKCYSQHTKSCINGLCNTTIITTITDIPYVTEKSREKQALDYLESKGYEVKKKTD